VEERRGIGFGVVEEGRRLCCMIKGYGGEYVAMGRGGCGGCMQEGRGRWVVSMVVREENEERRDQRMCE